MPGVYTRLTRKRWLFILVAAGLAVAVAGLVVFLSLPIRSETLKERVIALLSDQLDSEVTIDTLEGRIFPRVAVSGRGVVIRQRGRRDVPPLLTIARFEIRGSLRELLQRPRRVSEVRLEGLEVKIPAGDTGDDGPEKSASEKMSDAQRFEQVVIDRFEAPDTVVTIIPRRAGKQPKVFTIHHLVMDTVGINQTIPYIATLTNPVPKGEIEASGSFGPWNVVHPARTPVSGKYVFENANLATINGLSGMLTATGDFTGPLNRIEVHGTTESPDFQIESAGLPVPLSTRFTAVVDGSDGDTYLTRVDAKLLDTELVATGAVVGFDGVKGRQVEVDVTIANGRIENLLRLAVDSETPALVGVMRLDAKLVIPPEQKKVIDKISLRGEFGLTKAAFTDTSVQTKLTGLSRRGQGLTDGEPISDVVSDLKGRFVVDDGAVTFSQLTFGVPGAVVALHGGYGLRSQELDLEGEIRLQAALSQVLGGGVKGFFVKAFDPFFRKPGAGTVLPIRIGGTRKAPKFGLNLFNRKSR
jgi:uncharacterized protein involved in outer membrane biogenesis